jgi:hypothetical protein
VKHILINNKVYVYPSGKPIATGKVLRLSWSNELGNIVGTFEAQIGEQKWFGRGEYIGTAQNMCSIYLIEFEPGS